MKDTIMRKLGAGDIQLLEENSNECGYDPYNSPAQSVVGRELQDNRVVVLRVRRKRPVTMGEYLSQKTVG